MGFPMRINYFDLGLFHGTEMFLFREAMMPKIEFSDVFVYGFEPCEDAFKVSSMAPWTKGDNVELFNLAVGGEKGQRKIYHAENGVGNSLYPSKNNVGDKFEVVEVIKFSEWIEEHVSGFRNDINIMKINIEGAEYEVFRDLEENDLIKHIDIFCGAGFDIEKVPELKKFKNDYRRILREHNVDIKHFSARAEMYLSEEVFDRKLKNLEEILLSHKDILATKIYSNPGPDEKFRFGYTVFGHAKNDDIGRLILEAINNKINGEKNV